MDLSNDLNQFHLLVPPAINHNQWPTGEKKYRNNENSQALSWHAISVCLEFNLGKLLWGHLFSVIYTYKCPTCVMVMHHYICLWWFTHDMCKYGVKKGWFWVQNVHTSWYGKLMHRAAHGQDLQCKKWELEQFGFFFFL